MLVKMENSWGTLTDPSASDSNSAIQEADRAVCSVPA